MEGKKAPGEKEFGETEERRAASVQRGSSVMEGRRRAQGSRSQEGARVEERSPSRMGHTIADDANMQRLDQLLSKLGALANDAELERSADAGNAGESKNQCTDLINQFCSVDTLLKEHMQKDLKRERELLPKPSPPQLPIRGDDIPRREHLIPERKKAPVANHSNRSVDTRLETAIEQLMEATKSHLLNKKMEAQRMEDSLQRALGELDTVKAHEEQLLMKRFTYLEHQYRESASQLEREFAMRNNELRQAAISQIASFKQKSENAVLAKVESLLMELDSNSTQKSGSSGKLTAAASYLQNRLNQNEEDMQPYFNQEALYSSRAHDPPMTGDNGHDGWFTSSQGMEKCRRWDSYVDIAPDMEEVFFRTHTALEDRLKPPKLKSPSKLLFRPLRVSFGPSSAEDEFKGEDLHVDTVPSLPKNGIVLPAHARKLQQDGKYLSSAGRAFNI